MEKTYKKTDKRKNFDRWWKKNSHNQKAFYWLTKTAQRVMHDYAVPPEMFNHCKTIIKRYNCSEYRRLNSTEAYTLWRLVHPDMDERVKRLLQSGAYFAAQKAEYQKLKKSVDAG